LQGFTAGEQQLVRTYATTQVRFLIAKFVALDRVVLCSACCHPIYLLNPCFFNPTLQMTVRDALNSAMDEEMARDDKV
jgi:hypothetical protein